ncbi:MAG: GNAT family N-acetyltransferase [Clostridia bacterium]|nr:GNAT family N-acetyltransferase [Clostridia bacterium]MBR6668871.1 GNAT family N-acetyltransferase [Clostridia bacterium]
MSVTLRAPANPLDWLRIRLLYHQAFPRCERKPFKMIRHMQCQGRTDVWLAEQDGRFAGLAITINSEDVILLDYLAVHEKRRDKGMGSAMLQGLLALYEGRGLFVEIEATDRDDPTGIKARRKAFYLRNGLEDMHVIAMLFGVRMELLGRGCSLDFDAYHAFYRDNYSAWAADHVTRPEEN